MKSLEKDYDGIIIGAGQHGLVLGSYLAKAGLKVRIVEARDVVGGAAVTEEFAPGFRNSVASYTVSLLQPKVIADLNGHTGTQTVTEGTDAIVTLATENPSAGTGRIIDRYGPLTW